MRYEPFGVAVAIDCETVWGPQPKAEAWRRRPRGRKPPKERAIDADIGVPTRSWEVPQLVAGANGARVSSPLSTWD
jgi:hypothetical protein